LKQPIHLNTDLDQARARFVEGVEHFEAGRPEAARVAFEAALALAPGRASVLANLGATHLALGQWRDALDVLQRAAAADASQPDVWRNLGLAHKELGHWQAAADCLKRSLEAEPHAGLLLVLGQVQLKLGQVQAALSSFDRALEIDASFTPAWSERGSLLRELNRLDEAARSFEKAMELGADPELHAYYLASVRNASRNGMQNAAIPATSPRLYVEALFDQYAADFQRHAVEDLRYQGFQTLLRPLLEGGRRYGAVLDLGCGSGLCGRLIRPACDAVDGVDLSRAMLDEARKSGAYRDLGHADVAEYLAACERRYGLVLAADVFVYVGDLAEVFRQVRRVLEPGGCFAMTLERSPGNEDVVLQPSLRYAHSEAYVRRLAAAHGFQVSETFTAPIRQDQFRPIQGLYVYLT